MTLAMAVRTTGRLQRNLARYQEAVTGAGDAAIKADAALVRNSIRRQLRKKGSGKLYPSRRLRTAREALGRSVQAAERIRRLQDQREAEGRLTRGQTFQLDAAQRRLRKEARRLQRTVNRKGLRRGMVSPDTRHQASAPGEPPAPDIGTLPFAIQSGITDGERRVGPVNAWEGWNALQFGEGRVTGARPFMDAGLAAVRDQLKTTSVRVVRDRLGAVAFDLGGLHG